MLPVHSLISLPTTPSSGPHCLGRNQNLSAQGRRHARRLGCRGRSRIRRGTARQDRGRHRDRDRWGHHKVRLRHQGAWDGWLHRLCVLAPHPAPRPPPPQPRPSSPPAVCVQRAGSLQRCVRSWYRLLTSHGPCLDCVRQTKQRQWNPGSIGCAPKVCDVTPAMQNHRDLPVLV